MRKHTQNEINSFKDALKKNITYIKYGFALQK